MGEPTLSDDFVQLNWRNKKVKPIKQTKILGNKYNGINHSINKCLSRPTTVDTDQGDINPMGPFNTFRPDNQQEQNQQREQKDHDGNNDNGERMFRLNHETLQHRDPPPRFIPPTKSAHTGKWKQRPNCLHNEHECNWVHYQCIFLPTKRCQTCSTVEWGAEVIYFIKSFFTNCSGWGQFFQSQFFWSEPPCLPLNKRYQRRR